MVKKMTEGRVRREKAEHQGVAPDAFRGGGGGGRGGTDRQRRTSFEAAGKKAKKRRPERQSRPLRKKSAGGGKHRFSRRKGNVFEYSKDWKNRGYMQDSKNNRREQALKQKTDDGRGRERRRRMGPGHRA